MNELSGFTIAACVAVAFLGCVASGIVAMAVQHIVRWRMPGNRRARAVFWGVFSALFAVFLIWLLRPIVAPPVNFEMEFISPDGKHRLSVQDVTQEFTYNDLGWRLRAQLDDVDTGMRLGEMVVRHWHSGFDDDIVMMPTPEDVQVTWSKDSRSVLIEFGWVYAVLPEETYGQNIDGEEILKRFRPEPPTEDNLTP